MRLRPTAQGSLTPPSFDQDFLRIFFGCALQLAWTPVAYHVIKTSWIGMPLNSLIPILIFLLVFALSSGIIFAASRKLEENLQWILIFHCLLVLLGSVLALLSSADTELTTILQIISFSLLGIGFSLSIFVWEKSLVGISNKQTALTVLFMLMVVSLVFSACAYLSEIPICLISSGGAIVSTLLWKKQSAKAPDPVKQSRLLTLTGNQLLLRYWSSFALLGLCSGTMLALFASGIATPPDIQVTDFAMLGVVALAILLVLGWSRTREFDFLLTFSLLVLLALAAFFPLNPGTKFNQHISLIFGEAWLIALIGSLFFVSKEVDALCMLIGKRSTGLGAMSLSSGFAIGLVFAQAALTSSWFQGLEEGSHDRIVFVTTCGATTIAASYVCTNILISKDFLHNIQLLSKGRFASSLPLPLEPTSQQGKTLHTQSQSMESRCRAITLEKGLTPREFEVLVILAYGNSLSRVQSELVISEGTAITHRRNVYRKLDVHSKQELLDYIANFNN